MRGRSARVAVRALGGFRLGLADHDARPGILGAGRCSASGWTAGGERAHWLTISGAVLGFVLFMLHTLRIAKELARRIEPRGGPDTRRRQGAS